MPTFEYHEGPEIFNQQREEKMVDLGQYRLATIKNAQAELAKSKDQQDKHRQLFAASNAYRLEGVIGDMLANPSYTADYASALNDFVSAYAKLKQMI